MGFPRVRQGYRLPFFVAAISMGATGLLASNVWTYPSASSSTTWTGVIGFAVLAILCDTSFLRIAVNLHTSVAFIPLIGSEILLEQPWPMLIGGVTALTVQTFVRKKPLIRTVFNTAQYMLAIGLSAAVFHALGGTLLTREHFSLNAVAFVALVLTYFLVNSGSVVAVLTITGEGSIGAVWKRVIGTTILYDVVASCLAILLAYVYLKAQLLGLAVMTVPLYFIRDTYQTRIRLERMLPSASRREAPMAEGYPIERELGHGGMARVYLARDVKHGRPVAVKVLRSELAAAIGAERFLREIRIAADLHHPNVLPLLDSGSVEGVLYYVMPYIEGESLRDRLSRETRLAVEQALRIAGEVADALQYCHRRRVLHRDIKPENILLSGDHAIVADFGIAKALSTAGSGSSLTDTGVRLGTPGYMSPEQAAGSIDLDERTDIYSLAVVVYEMLVGELPHTWPLPEPGHPGRFAEVASSHRTRLTELGDTIEAALVHGLAIQRDERTPTPAALIAELSGAPESPR